MMQMIGLLLVVRPHSVSCVRKHIDSLRNGFLVPGLFRTAELGSEVIAVIEDADRQIVGLAPGFDFDGVRFVGCFLHIHDVIAAVVIVHDLVRRLVVDGGARIVRIVTRFVLPSGFFRSDPDVKDSGILEQVRSKLAEPFGEEDYQRAENELKEARCCYADAMMEDNLNAVRRQAGGALYHVENALALLNKTYFRKGTRRRFEELNAMEKRPEQLCRMIDDILTAADVNGVKECLTVLMKEMKVCFEKAHQPVRPEKKAASISALSGSFEEMFSNWHGKMVLAAECGDRYLAFMSLESFNEMLRDISSELEIGSYDAFSAYDPGDLQKTLEQFDMVLQDYLQEYKKVGYT